MGSLCISHLSQHTDQVDMWPHTVHQPLDRNIERQCFRSPHSCDGQTAIDCRRRRTGHRQNTKHHRNLLKTKIGLVLENHRLRKKQLLDQDPFPCIQPPYLSWSSRHRILPTRFRDSRPSAALQENWNFQMTAIEVVCCCQTLTVKETNTFGTFHQLQTAGWCLRYSHIHWHKWYKDG